MGTFDPEHPVILGNIGEATVYVQDATGEWHDFNHYDYFRVKKAMNQISEFEIKIYDIQDAEKVYFKEKAIIIFLIDNTILLKGRIQDIEYGTTYECVAKGFGMEAALIDKELTQRSNTTATWVTAKKCSYTNKSAQTIVKEMLSSNTDGASPWIIQPATTGIFASDYGNVTLVFENTNRLKAVNTICEAIAGTQSATDYDNTSYEWWVAQDTYYGGTSIIDYDSDDFHLEQLRPTTTRATNSQYSFAITGAGANCSKTSREKDISNLVNYITVLGSGDGSSQISTSTYAASTTFSVLSADILVGDTTIGLADATSFPNSGEIRVAEERITYSGKSGNNLTGCTRGANGTTARPHKKNVYTEIYYSADTPETGSPLDTYGLMDYTYTDKGLIDREIMEVMASNSLLERMNPVLRIKVVPDEPDTIASNLDIGDLVTIVDAESAINDSYRIQSIEYKSDYGVLSCELECSNKSLTFTEQMQKNKDVTDSLNKFSQGSSIMNIQNAGNLDSTHDLNLRFYMPSDVINVSEGLLSFKIQDYRTEVTGASSSTENSHEHDFSDSDTVSISDNTGSSGTGATGGPSATTSKIEITSITTQSLTGMIYNPAITDHQHYLLATEEDPDTPSNRGLIASSSSYDFPTTTHTHTGPSHTHTFSGSDTVSISGTTTGNSGHAHTITVNYGIHEISSSGAIVGVLVGDDGTETALSTALDSGTASSGGATTLTDSTKTWAVDFWADAMVYITAGTGAGQARIITSNTATALTVPAWDTNPDNTSVYAIYATYNSNQTSIDIKTNLVNGGIGTWQNIRFIGNKTMRIEANAYIRLFV